MMSVNLYIRKNILMSYPMSLTVCLMIPPSFRGFEGARARIFKEAMGARNRGGRGLLYRPARLHRLAEFIPWNRFRGPIHVQKYQLMWVSRMVLRW
jgi:hypothetical protein